MDSETSYRSAKALAERGYQIGFISAGDKHAGCIAELMIDLVTAKTNRSMMENMTPNYMWLWAIFNATRNFN